MKKRIFNVLLASILSVLVLATNVFTVSASTQKIDEINVTVSIPKVSTTGSAVDFTVSDDRYTVTTSKQWIDAGGVAEATEFISGNDYRAMFNVVAAAGYEITADTIVKVNGSQDNVDLLGGNSTPASDFEFLTLPELLGTVEQINIDDIPNVDIGDKSAEYVYNGENYSVNGIWQKYDYDTKEFADITVGTEFTDKNIYRLKLTAKTQDGYEFGDGCELYINGDYYNIDRSYSSVTAYYYVNFATLIENITINEKLIPKVKVGDKFKESDVIKLGNAKGYEAVGYWIYTDEEGIMHKNGTFKKGKAYTLVVEVFAKSVYTLSEHLNFELDEEVYFATESNFGSAKFEVRKSFATIIDTVKLLDLPKAVVGEKIKKGEFNVKVPKNAKYTAKAYWMVLNGEEWNNVESAVFEKGKAYELWVDLTSKSGYEFKNIVIVNAYGIDQKVYAGGYDSLTYVRQFSFRKVIDKIEIEGVIEPKAAAKATVNTIKAPKGANYSIENAYWMDMEDYSMVDNFQKGHIYSLILDIRAKDGYEFSNNALAFVNGKKEDFDKSETQAQISKEYSLKTTIKKVELENIPVMKIGETAKSDIKLPKDAKYTAMANWSVWNEAKQEYVAFEGKFETGKVYALNLFVLPKDSYGFSEETVLIVDGKKVKDAAVFPFAVDYRKEYFTEQKVIDKVEIKIEKYKVGNHASIMPQISIITKGCKAVDKDGLTNWLYGDFESNRVYHSFFEENGQYGVSFALLADSGYVFAEDLEVVVNGVVLPKKAIRRGIKMKSVDYFFDMQTKADGNKGKTNKNDDTNKEVEYSPLTQDNSLNNVMALLCVVSLISACVLFFRKRIWDVS
ncbi:MAG: hypothetical protein IJD45_06325 [Clostridia bacterium]|nr:hypothetical protein [Clostridia bacterium]